MSIILFIYYYYNNLSEDGNSTTIISVNTTFITITLEFFWVCNISKCQIENNTRCVYAIGFASWGNGQGVVINFVHVYFYNEVALLFFTCIQAWSILYMFIFTNVLQWITITFYFIFYYYYFYNESKDYTPKR